MVILVKLSYRSLPFVPNRPEPQLAALRLHGGQHGEEQAPVHHALGRGVVRGSHGTWAGSCLASRIGGSENSNY